MKAQSIRSHLKPYSIVQKRRTTVHHAFASALAPVDDYDERAVADALTALGQHDLDRLVCAYCTEPASTWDHLVNLVKDKKLNGYGHQVGNLVPCCKACNSSKGGKDFHEFVRLLNYTDAERSDLISRLERHQLLAEPYHEPEPGTERAVLMAKFAMIQEQILSLMAQADEIAKAARETSPTRKLLATPPDG